MIFEIKNKVGNKRTLNRFALWPVVLEEDEEGNRKYIWFQFYKVDQEYYCASGTHEDGPRCFWLTRKRFL